MSSDLALVPREQTCAYSIVSSMRALEDSNCLGTLLAWALIIAALAISFFTIVGLYPFMALANEWGAQTCAEQLEPQLQEKAQLEQQLGEANEQNTKVSSELGSAQKELQTARTEAEQVRKTQTSLVEANSRLARKTHDLEHDLEELRLQREALLAKGGATVELIKKQQELTDEVALSRVLLKMGDILPPGFSKPDKIEALAKLIQEQAEQLEQAKKELHHTERQLDSAQRRYNEAAHENEQLKLQLHVTKLRPARS